MRPGTRLPTPEDARAKADGRALWETDRAALLFQRPFIATLALRMPLVPVVDHRVPTACTDGESIWFNPYFLAPLSPPERVFVLAHEIWHCVMLHPLRRGERTPRRWNLAVDQEVNALLLHDGWKMPEGAFYDPALDDLSAEAVYDRLPEEAAAALSIDTHLEPRPGGLASAAPDALAGGDGSPAERGPRATPDAGSDAGSDAGEDGGADAAPVEDPDFAPGRDGRERFASWPGRAQMAAAQCRTRGLLSDREDRVLAALGSGRVDWRRLLRDFVTRTIGGDRAWTPPARRHVHRGLYLPSIRQPQIEVSVAVDTSGSVHAALPTMLGELRGLLDAFGRWEIQVLWADAEVQRVERWTSEDAPLRFDVPMGGGTDFRPVFRHLADDPPPLLIYITDGFGPAPAHPPGYPVLWVLIEPDCTPPAPWGQCVVFDAKAAA